MKKVLVVTQAFGDYAVGAVITDPAEIKDLKADRPSYVVLRDQTPEEAEAERLASDPAPVVDDKSAKK